MKKLAMLNIIAVILAIFSVSSSGCGGNLNQYFANTDEIVKVDDSTEVEIKELFVEKEPEFYNPGVYTENKELFLSDSIKYNSSDLIKTEIAPFGLLFSGVNFEEKKYDRYNIVVDNSKYLSGYEETKLFDKNNSLSYTSNRFDKDYYLDGIVRCNKLTNDKSVESWFLELPFKKNLICQRTLGNNLIVYGQNDIVLIDTKHIKITNSYKLKSEKLQIMYIIPQGDFLWIFCVDRKVGLSNLFSIFGAYDILPPVLNHGYKGYPHSATVFVVDVSSKTQSALRFAARIAQVKYDGNKIALSNNIDDLFIVDENLNTQHFKLSELHKGATFADLFTANRYLNIETDCIGIKLSEKKYALNIENPYELIDIPEGLENINYSLRGCDWDYCYKKDGYFYGYNIYTKETTWKFKTESIYDHPFYSTENGIMLGNWYMDKQKFIVNVYTEKK